MRYTCEDCQYTFTTQVPSHSEECPNCTSRRLMKSTPTRYETSERANVVCGGCQQPIEDEPVVLKEEVFCQTCGEEREYER
jgi:DNA-directed RNA polymerase subunit RPC12/RpoP